MRVLVDSGALLGLYHARDQHHAQAVAAAQSHRASGGRYLGTTLILAEFHSRLLYLRGTREARRAVALLLDDQTHEWIPVSAELARDATANWLTRFADQAFSLTDAVSFEVMRREKITHAFAFDRHFQVAGFELLRAGRSEKGR